MLSRAEFSRLYRETCYIWWENWKQAAQITDIDERNAFLDRKCVDFMHNTGYIHEAMLMEKLTQVAKMTLEMYQYPAIGREGYEKSPF